MERCYGRALGAAIPAPRRALWGDSGPTDLRFEWKAKAASAPIASMPARPGEVLRPAYSMNHENEAVVRRYTEDLLEKTVSVIARSI